MCKVDGIFKRSLICAYSCDFLKNNEIYLVNFYYKMQSRLKNKIFMKKKEYYYPIIADILLLNLCLLNIYIRFMYIFWFFIDIIQIMLINHTNLF